MGTTSQLCIFKYINIHSHEDRTHNHQDYNQTNQTKLNRYAVNFQQTLKFKWYTEGSKLYKV